MKGASHTGIVGRVFLGTGTANAKVLRSNVLGFSENQLHNDWNAGPKGNLSLHEIANDAKPS